MRMLNFVCIIKLYWYSRGHEYGVSSCQPGTLNHADGVNCIEMVTVDNYLYQMYKKVFKVYVNAIHYFLTLPLLCLIVIVF